jgi:hypothetical protein
MTIRPISIAVLLAVSTLLAGCQDNNPKDVAAARADAARDVASARDAASTSIANANDKVDAARADYVDQEQGARKTLTAVEAEAMAKRAHADYDVGTAQVDGAFSVARQKCDSYTGVDKTACLSTADAKRAMDQAQITASRDAALVAANHH